MEEVKETGLLLIFYSDEETLHLLDEEKLNNFLEYLAEKLDLEIAEEPGCLDCALFETVVRPIGSMGIEISLPDAYTGPGLLEETINAVVECVYNAVLFFNIAVANVFYCDNCEEE